MSHDKIRVAPRHRRAPTRKGVASVRHGGHDITDGNVIPRSRSVGARIQGNVLVEQSEVQPNVEEMKQERENLRKKMEMADEQRQLEQEEAKQKQLEDEKQKLEQEKLEQQKREQEKLEEETLEQERLENQKLEEEKRQKEKLEKERLEQEKLEKQRLEQEKQERLEKEKLEQDKLEKLKLEQEKLKHERLVEENRQQQVNDKLNQYNIRQTTDFSDLAESLRSSANSKETYSVETTEVEMKETTSEQKHDTSRDISEIRGVALYQNIDIDNVKTKDSHAVLDIEINTDDRQTTNDFAVSPLLAEERVTASTNQEIRGTNQVTVVEQSGEFQPMSISEEDVHSENITSKHPETVKVPAVGEKISEDNTVVTVEEEESPPLSPQSNPPSNPPSSPPSSPSSYSTPSSCSTPRSPVRSKRLVIETPEKVYQKPIMSEVRTEEAETKKENGRGGIQRNRPQSMHSRIRPVVEENNRTQDDSNLGVAKLKQAFERSSRSQTISYDRRKKPEVLPKPKPPSKPKQSQSLERNYRFPVTASKPHEVEKSVQKSPKKQNDDVVVVLDEVPDKVVEKKASVSSSLTKKAPGPKPKPLPKPQPKIKPNATTKTADEGKENIKVCVKKLEKLYN